MLKVLLVGIGGFVGSVLRYWLSGYVQTLSRSFEFPYGTLAVNVIGCFVIGVLAQLVDDHGAFSPGTRAFLFVGILGGFTTFSTFGNETLNLLRDNEQALALANLAVHVVLGLGAAWGGRAIAHAIWG
ncbi:MAG TPA: fluoride efflux transporter CrcB [Blastocatellia bacterium]|nr:fluoride efflux transporter CrcB [Blastocatellia bacterium]